jgi:hypothetical protein
VCWLSECNWPEDGLYKAETCSPYFSIKHSILVVSDWYINILVETMLPLTKKAKFSKCLPSHQRYLAGSSSMTEQLRRKVDLDDQTCLLEEPGTWLSFVPVILSER